MADIRQLGEYLVKLGETAVVMAQPNYKDGKQKRRERRALERKRNSI